MPYPAYEPKSGWKWARAPMVGTRVAEFDATGNPSTRLFQTLLDGKSGQLEVGGGGAAGFAVGFGVARGAGDAFAAGRGVGRGVGRAVGTDVARADGFGVAACPAGVLVAEAEADPPLASAAAVALGSADWGWSSADRPALALPPRANRINRTVTARACTRPFRGERSCAATRSISVRG